MINYQTKKRGFIHILTFKRKLVCGFTLVEMMVAIAVFSVVMVAAMSALLNVIDANNKARAIKTAINNVNFALEGISKDMRMGTDYTCGDEICSPGGNASIKYRSNRADFESGDSGPKKFAHYKFEAPQILECLEKNNINCGANSDYQPITSSEVTLTSVKFYVLNDDLATTDVIEQPRVIIAIRGKAGPSNKEKLQTTFDLQTSVSQRIRVEIKL